MRNSWIRATLLVTAAVITPASVVVAESARDVLQAAVERNDKRLKGIENFTVVQEVMGFEVTSYYEVRSVNGHSVAVAKDDSADEMAMPYAHFSEMAEHAHLQGTETIDGRKCYAIRVDDLSRFDLDPEVGEEASDFRPTRGTFYLDREEYLLRKMEIEGEADHEGETVPVTMQMVLTDYRKIDGLVHPFVTEMAVRGLTSGLSAEEMAEARESLAAMKEKMADMPEDQREMMTAMMGEQMGRLEEMVNTGEMKMTMQVKEVRVNQGAPKE